MSKSKRQQKVSLLQCAAILCSHVASGERPILIAERDEPEDPADSGWQFLCGEDHEDWREAKVWSVREILEIEQTLTPFINLEPTVRLVRLACDGDWINVPNQSDTN